MKTWPRADYPVQVRPQSWEEEENVAALYEGVVEVRLNHHVDIAFVPDVSEAAPPWHDQLLPDDLDQITRPEQARLATALLASYVVTPNEARAGTDEVLPMHGADGPRLVCYVSVEEFARFSADLATLTTQAGALHTGPAVSTLREHPVIGFIEQRIVASPHLSPQDRHLLAR